MTMASRTVEVSMTEEETHSYELISEADQHDRFMITAGWSRTDTYEHDKRIYQTFRRETRMMS